MTSDHETSTGQDLPPVEDLSNGATSSGEGIRIRIVYGIEAPPLMREVMLGTIPDGLEDQEPHEIPLKDRLEQWLTDVGRPPYRGSHRDGRLQCIPYGSTTNGSPDGPRILVGIVMSQSIGTSVCGELPPELFTVRAMRQEIVWLRNHAHLFGKAATYHVIVDFITGSTC